MFLFDLYHFSFKFHSFGRTILLKILVPEIKVFHVFNKNETIIFTNQDASISSSTLVHIVKYLHTYALSQVIFFLIKSNKMYTRDDKN